MNNQREIEFRVWDGSTMWYDAMVGGFEDTVPTVYIKSRGWVNVDPFVIQQYTGLEDKNGKKIFEGDIVKIAMKNNQGGLDIYPVTYSFGRFVFKDIDTSLYPLCISSDFEVIGNIFENEELIKTL